MLIMDIHDSIVDIHIWIWSYEDLEFTTVVDIHNSVIETIMDITVQIWISIFANWNNLQYSYKLCVSMILL